MQNFIITAVLNATLFFASHPPAHKIFIKPGQQYTAQELNNRLTPEIRAWYANNAKNNRVLNELVDAFIVQLQSNDCKQYLSYNKKPPLVIFDIDETILTAYSTLSATQTTAKKISYATSSSIETMTILQPFQRLYNFLIEHNILIAFVSARSSSPYLHTKIIHKLNDSGYLSIAAILLYSAKNQSTAQWKESARNQLADKYTIIATIDDDWRNLVGENVGRYALWVPGCILSKPHEQEFYEQLRTTQTHQTVTVAARTYNTASSCV